MLRALILSLGIFACFNALLGAAEDRRFYAAPPPSDFQPDTGDTPLGEGKPLAMLSEVPIKLSFSAREGYDSNLFATHTDTYASAFSNAAFGANYSFGSPRLNIEANLGGGATYYYTRPGNKMDYNGQFSLSSMFALSPKISLALSSTTAYLSQPDTNVIGGSSRVDGDYITQDAKVAVAYKWSTRLATESGYQFFATHYLNPTLNDTQSFISQTAKQDVSWRLRPLTSAVLEYRANLLTYPGEKGMSSFGNFALVGFDQTFNPKFKWSGRAGLEQRFIQNPVDGPSTYLGPFGESNLSLQYGPTSLITWNARYGTEPSGLTNVSQRQTLRTGLSVTHGFTPRISGILGIGVENDYFNQPGVVTTFSQTIFDASVGVKFKVNKNVSLNASYQFINVNAPKDTSFEYTRNVTFAGVNVSF